MAAFRSPVCFMNFWADSLPTSLLYISILLEVALFLTVSSSSLFNLPFHHTYSTASTTASIGRRAVPRPLSLFVSEPYCTAVRWPHASGQTDGRSRMHEDSQFESVLSECVCLLLQDLLQSCSRGGRGIVEDMCYERRRAEALED